MRRSVALALLLVGCRKDIAAKRDPEASPVRPPTDLVLIARTSDVRTLGGIPAVVVGHKLSSELGNAREAVLILYGPEKRAAFAARSALDESLILSSEVSEAPLHRGWASAELETAKHVPAGALELHLLGALQALDASSFSRAGPMLLSELSTPPEVENRTRVLGALFAFGRGRATFTLHELTWTIPLDHEPVALGAAQVASLPHAHEFDAWTPLGKQVAAVHPNADPAAVTDLERLVEPGASRSSDNSCGLGSLAIRLRVRDAEAAKLLLARIVRAPAGGNVRPWNAHGFEGSWMTEPKTGQSKHEDGVRHLAAISGNDLILLRAEPTWWITFERKCPSVEELVSPMLSRGSPSDEAAIRQACGDAPVVLYKPPAYGVCVTREGKGLRVRAKRKDH